jgi:hypothetical protein
MKRKGGPDGSPQLPRAVDRAERDTSSSPDASDEDALDASGATFGGASGGEESSDACSQSSPGSDASGRSGLTQAQNSVSEPHNVDFGEDSFDGGDGAIGWLDQTVGKRSRDMSPDLLRAAAAAEGGEEATQVLKRGRSSSEAQCDDALPARDGVAQGLGRQQSPCSPQNMQPPPPFERTEAAEGSDEEPTDIPNPPKRRKK